MFGRALARLVTTLALLAASVAWMGWIYLHTVADPTRSDRIAHAILDDPRARHEVAVDISNGLATAADKALKSHGAPAIVDGGDPALQTAVEASLADPGIAANLVDAISAEHARALGETPAHPAAINTGALVAAVRAHLLPVEPGVARAIPALAPSAIKLPAARIPFARQLRSFADRWVRLLALGAVGGAIVAFLIGDRPGVLRRVGFWAIGAGLTWAILPRLVAWGGDHWVRSQAAVIRAVLQGATGSVTAVATVLAVAGIGAVVVSYAAPQVLGVLGTGDGRRAAGGGPSPAPRPTAGASPTTGAWSTGRRTAPPTDSWTPHAEAPREAPIVYDRHGQLGAGPSRRPGVSRAALGLDNQRATPDAPFDQELDPTGPLPPVTPGQ